MVTNITWKQGLTLPHDLDDVGDIEVDMTELVGVDDSVSDVQLEDSGVTGTLVSFTPQGVVVFRVEYGSPGLNNFVTVQAIMYSGRKQSRTIYFNVIER